MKKQTIWLLTMLSLVVVLSVYYVTTPDQIKTAGYMNMTSNKESNPLDSTPNDTSKTDKNSQTANVGSNDEVFLKQRMEQEDQRSQLIDEYKATVASATSTAEEKSVANAKMTELMQLNALETDVETMIKEAGYKDALVRANNSEVQVDVKSSKPSRKAANDIIQMTRSVLGEKLVVVNFVTK